MLMCAQTQLFLWNKSLSMMYAGIFSDLTITVNKLKQLFKTVMDPDKVDKLREELGLPQSEIERIQNNYHIPTQRKEAYLDLYVHQHPCPSWSGIAYTLRYTFNLVEEANFVESTYVKGMLL